MSAAREAVTLRDVAALAGVSIRTVSNVVNGSVPVRTTTRTRVQDAIARLGYRPNMAARRLRSGRSHAIGLVLPDVTIPYFRELADAVLAAARHRRMAIVVVQTHGDPGRERAVPSSPRLRHVDGVILAAVSLTEEDFRALPRSLPVVLAGASVRSQSIDSIAADTHAAGRSVARHLLARGRRCPAVIRPADTHWPAEYDARYRGFAAGLADAGLALPDRHVITTDVNSFAAGAHAAQALYPELPEVDALFALGDSLALGALRGLCVTGRRVPRDVAVVGFGNIEHSAHSNPTLTTVDPGRLAIAEQAVALIADRVEANSAGQERAGTPDLRPPRRFTVDFRLIERESTRVAG
ncbi:LacI family DNA-binding transcriptional regulator [Streptomyces sp. WMMC500]|uniref:LacI family DNA-binding transcriptional regulator n=1 Tax=Streptomyces sp. WMMC500 TaxID=3015154 RepID=UPI00248B20F4|nr:LacI family DNA-binding transcriptional regulator [Streptomyces sp. WMMC500]WBB62035.1 LacI family DNA-binding transcriptional regulator [Streptomyces sp. WMMC500]